MYGDEEAPEGSDEREIPKSIWHDRKKVDEWVEMAKKRRKSKNSSDIDT